MNTEIKHPIRLAFVKFYDSGPKSVEPNAPETYNRSKAAASKIQDLVKVQCPEFLDPNTEFAMNREGVYIEKGDRTKENILKRKEIKKDKALTKSLKQALKSLDKEVIVFAKVGNNNELASELLNEKKAFEKQIRIIADLHEELISRLVQGRSQIQSEEIKNQFGDLKTKFFVLAATIDIFENQLCNNQSCDLDQIQTAYQDFLAAFTKWIPVQMEIETVIGREDSKQFLLDVDFPRKMASFFENMNENRIQYPINSVLDGDKWSQALEKIGKTSAQFVLYRVNIDLIKINFSSLLQAEKLFLDQIRFFLRDYETHQKALLEAGFDQNGVIAHCGNLQTVLQRGIAVYSKINEAKNDIEKGYLEKGLTKLQNILASQEYTDYAASIRELIILQRIIEEHENQVVIDLSGARYPDHFRILMEIRQLCSQAGIEVSDLNLESILTPLKAADSDYSRSRFNQELLQIVAGEKRLNQRLSQIMEGPISQQLKNSGLSPWQIAMARMCLEKVNAASAEMKEGLQKAADLSNQNQDVLAMGRYASLLTNTYPRYVQAIQEAGLFIESLKGGSSNCPLLKDIVGELKQLLLASRKHPNHFAALQQILTSTQDNSTEPSPSPLFKNESQAAITEETKKDWEIVSSSLTTASEEAAVIRDNYLDLIEMHRFIKEFGELRKMVPVKDMGWSDSRIMKLDSLLNDFARETEPLYLLQRTIEMEGDKDKKRALTAQFHALADQRFKKIGALTHQFNQLEGRAVLDGMIDSLGNQLLAIDQEIAKKKDDIDSLFGEVHEKGSDGEIARDKKLTLENTHLKTLLEQASILKAALAKTNGLKSMIEARADFINATFHKAHLKMDWELGRAQKILSPILKEKGEIAKLLEYQKSEDAFIAAWEPVFLAREALLEDPENRTLQVNFKARVAENQKTLARADQYLKAAKTELTEIKGEIEKKIQAYETNEKTIMGYQSEFKICKEEQKDLNEKKEIIENEIASLKSKPNYEEDNNLLNQLENLKKQLEEIQTELEGIEKSIAKKEISIQELEKENNDTFTAEDKKRLEAALEKLAGHQKEIERQQTLLQSAELEARGNFSWDKNSIEKLIKLKAKGRGFYLHLTKTGFSVQDLVNLNRIYKNYVDAAKTIHTLERRYERDPENERLRSDLVSALQKKKNEIKGLHTQFEAWGGTEKLANLQNAVHSYREKLQENDPLRLIFLNLDLSSSLKGKIQEVKTTYQKFGVSTAAEPPKIAMPAAAQFRQLPPSPPTADPLPSVPVKATIQPSANLPPPPPPLVQAQTQEPPVALPPAPPVTTQPIPNPAAKVPPPLVQASNDKQMLSAALPPPITLPPLTVSLNASGNAPPPPPPPRLAKQASEPADQPAEKDVNEPIQAVEMSVPSSLLGIATPIVTQTEASASIPAPIEIPPPPPMNNDDEEDEEDIVPPPPPPLPENALSTSQHQDLLNQIREGIQLKPPEKKKEQKEKISDNDKQDLVSMLTEALDKRYTHIQGPESDDDSDNEEDWNLTP